MRYILSVAGRCFVDLVPMIVRVPIKFQTICAGVARLVHGYKIWIPPGDGWSRSLGNSDIAISEVLDDCFLWTILRQDVNQTRCWSGAFLKLTVLAKPEIANIKSKEWRKRDTRQGRSSERLEKKEGGAFVMKVGPRRLEQPKEGD